MNDRFRAPRLDIIQLAPENNESLTKPDPNKAVKKEVTSIIIALREVEVAKEFTRQFLGNQYTKAA